MKRDSGHVANQDCWVWIGICRHHNEMNDVEGLSDCAGKIPKIVDALHSFFQTSDTVSIVIHRYPIHTVQV